MKALSDKTLPLLWEHARRDDRRARHTLTQATSIATDLEIPVEELLTVEQEAHHGHLIQQGFRRLDRHLRSTVSGYEQHCP